MIIHSSWTAVRQGSTKRERCMRKDRAFITAAVRGAAFALATIVFTVIPVFHGYLWCLYIGFFLTMAFGVKRQECLNYVCSLLAGYVWAFGYVYSPAWLEEWSHMPSVAALAVCELVLTFLLIYVHVKFLHATPLNKVPAAFAAIATVFASGGPAHIPLCAVSAVLGILMAIVTEIIIVRICD